MGVGRPIRSLFIARPGNSRAPPHPPWFSLSNQGGRERGKGCEELKVSLQRGYIYPSDLELTALCKTTLEYTR